MLDRLHRRLIELQPGRVGSPVLQKSPLGQAIRYTLGQWEALVRYLEDGRYEIDTNLVENAIRPTCIGQLEDRVKRHSGGEQSTGSRHPPANALESQILGNHVDQRTLTGPDPFIERLTVYFRL